MPSQINVGNALAKLIGLLDENNRRDTDNPNKAIHKSSHQLSQQLVLDDLKTRLTPSGVTHIWGPGGLSDEAGSGTDALSARWSFTAVWG